MRTLYIDCGMGTAGDMLAGALLELIDDKERFLRRINELGIPGVTVSVEKSVKCGIAGTHFSVKMNDREEDADIRELDHHHIGMDDIDGIVSTLPVPTAVKLDIMAVYNSIAEAESHVHGVDIPYIHFHEIGSMDALADITAVSLLLHELRVEQVLVSPVCVGSGSVRCAHGILPVPAPATAHILRNVPIYGGSISGELCTPTGAALLKHFADGFGDMPPMKVNSIGYGMGKKDFERANCVRVMLGESEEKTDSVVELICNVDDMTGEAISFALERFLEFGALDAFTVPVGMKKSRPGVMITVLCREEDKEKMIQLLFRHTSTLGIRQRCSKRYTLERRTETVDTPYGELRKKISTGYGVSRSKYEYEDLARVAKEKGISIAQVLESIT